MPKYEYELTRILSGSTVSDHEEHLNALGALGWEYVGVVKLLDDSRGAAYTTEHQYWLMRREIDDRGLQKV